MNLKFLEEQFKRLEYLEQEVEYEFEPKAKTMIGKRNIYYEDLKNDFKQEIHVYGFSPFCIDKFETQRKNPMIMKYMNKDFNHGLTNFIKRRNRKKPQKYIKGKLKLSSPIKSKCKKKNNVKNEKDQNENLTENKGNVLQKALKVINNKKLNVSSDEEDERKDYFNKNDNDINPSNPLDEQKKMVEAAKKKLRDELMKKYYKSIQDSLPAISISQYDKPDALKINFENNFGNLKSKFKTQLKSKKIVALSKNKEYLLNSDNNFLNGVINNKGNEANINRVNTNDSLTKSKDKNVKQKSKKSKFNKNRILSAHFSIPIGESKMYKALFDKEIGKDEFLLIKNKRDFKREPKFDISTQELLDELTKNKPYKKYYRTFKKPIKTDNSIKLTINH